MNPKELNDEKRLPRLNTRSKSAPPARRLATPFSQSTAYEREAASSGRETDAATRGSSVAHAEEAKANGTIAQSMCGS